MLRGLTLLGVLATSLLVFASAEEDLIAKFVESLTEEDKKIMKESDEKSFDQPTEKLLFIKGMSETLHAKLTEYIKTTLNVRASLGDAAKAFVADFVANLYVLNENSISDLQGREILRGSKKLKALSDFARAEIRRKLPLTFKVFDSEDKIVKSQLMKKTEFLFELSPGGFEYFSGLNLQDKEVAMIFDDRTKLPDECFDYQRKELTHRREIKNKTDSLRTAAKKFFTWYNEKIENHRDKEFTTAQLKETTSEMWDQYDMILRDADRAEIKTVFPAFNTMLNSEGSFLRLLTFITYQKR